MIASLVFSVDETAPVAALKDLHAVIGEFNVGARALTVPVLVIGARRLTLSPVADAPVLREALARLPFVLGVGSD